MSLRDDLTRLIDLALLNNYRPPLLPFLFPPPPYPRLYVVCARGRDTSSHLFRRRDLTQIAFLKSIIGRCYGGAAAALNYYYRIRFPESSRTRRRRRRGRGGSCCSNRKCTRTILTLHERLSLINVRRELDPTSEIYYIFCGY